MPIKIKRGREQSRASVRTSRATAMPPTIPASGRQTRPTAGKNSTSARTTMLALFDADQPRVGQPVTGDALHRRAGQPQHGPAQQRHQDPRQADIKQNKARLLAHLLRRQQARASVDAGSG